ncbi:tRNA (adenosine(37)-N6)-threonylcarbamoyltransferase complex transferase subunit TsaD [bacterium]|jgi:N6-L-threonylcarbamoyladenine synthase|nr:tRNA (adenosine(37)-N6)-threonylcarbamoyltransferase complex transferase subunit TsaD [bacterium]
MPHKILSIETSCDETAAAVYESEKGLMSSVLFSQVEQHKKFGGVVPELASRSHIEKISTIVQDALKQANSTFESIDIVAVTNSPGLPGSLLVGLCFAKSIAWAKNKKLIGVNHVEGHIFSSFLEQNVPFPHLCLVASGGHTSLCLVKDFGKYEVIGKTLDDAAGEAFDKIAKLINLPYPGGPIIENLATEERFYDFFTYPRSNKKTLNFSFSGLKTAVLYDLVKRGHYDMKTKTFLNSKDTALQKKVASSLLVCIGDIFCEKIELALKPYPEVKAVTFAGGVACNKYLKQRISKICDNKNIPFFAPSPKFCTDNGAMIAFVAQYKAEQNKFSNLELDIFT